VGYVLLLVPSHHGVMGVSVCLPLEAKCVGLLCMANQWAWAPLVVTVMLGTYGSEPYAALGMPRTVLGVVHERSSPHILVV
jgi:hypothetical protein